MNLFIFLLLFISLGVTFSQRRGLRKEHGAHALSALRRQLAELRQDFQEMQRQNGVHLHMHGNDMDVQQDSANSGEVVLSDSDVISNATVDHTHHHGHYDDDAPKGTHIYMHMVMDMDGQMGKMGEKMKKMGMCPMMMKKMKKIRPDGYMYARCDVSGNTAVPLEQRSPIHGTIFMKQKYAPKGPVEVSLDLSGFDSAPSHSHGMHIHEFGDVSNGCQSLGGHFNPTEKSHGAPASQERHLGDWGNIQCDEDGNVIHEFEDDHTSLTGAMSIIGRSIVIHAGVDDLGTGGNEGSKASGNAGARIACCIIGQDRNPEPDTED